MQSPVSMATAKSDLFLRAIATVLEMMRRMLTWRMGGREWQHSEGR